VLASHYYSLCLTCVVEYLDIKLWTCKVWGKITQWSSMVFNLELVAFVSCQFHSELNASMN